MQLWEPWCKDQRYGDLMRRRALGEELEMESAKQLVRLMKDIYQPGMVILDVGCGAGHFIRTLKQLDGNLRYCGLDITQPYLGIAQQVWSSTPPCEFVCGNAFELPIKSDSCDIVTCVTVLQNLPEYHTPVRELFRVSREVMIIRLLLSDFTHIIKRYEGHNSEFVYYNIWSTEELTDYVYDLGARQVDVLPDEFNVKLERTHSTSTYTYGDLQINGNIVMTWKWVRAFK